MKKSNYLMGIIAASALFACSEVELTDIREKTEENVKEIETVEDDLRAKEEDIFNAPRTRRKEIALDEGQKVINEKLNTFSWDLFTKTFDNKKETNLLLSPFSLTQNLMMLSNGLRGQSLEEIKLAFGLSEFEMEDMNRYSLQLNKGLEEADSRTKYRTDNSIWYRNDMIIQPDFAENVSQYYHAEAFPAAMNAETLDSINNWAYQRTYGRIKDFLPSLSPGMASVLINTVYFRGLWHYETSDIKYRIFHNENGEEENVKFAKLDAKSYYSENSLYQAACEFLGNRAFAMDFILPKEGVNPTEALRQYINDGVPSWIKILKLDYPLFESESKMSLDDLLHNMGINGIYNPQNTSDMQLFNKPTFVSSVIQQTSIAVSEKGVEAAAGTINIPGTEGYEPQPDTVFVTLERPFFYTIRETSTNTPLFIGYQGSVK
jgi:serpin B